MSQLVAATLSAIAVLAASYISTQQKSPEEKILDLNRVLNETDLTGEQRQYVKGLIEKQFQRLGIFNWSKAFLYWAVIGATALVISAFSVGAFGDDKAEDFYYVVALCYLIATFVLLIASLTGILLATHPPRGTDSGAGANADS